MRLFTFVSFLSTAVLAAPPVVSTPSPVDPVVMVPSRNGNGLAFAQGISGGGVGLVVWVDTRVPNGTRKIWATRVAAVGQPLDKPMLELGDGDGTPDNVRRRVTFNGTHFVVAWVDPGQRSILSRGRLARCPSGLAGVGSRRRDFAFSLLRRHSGVGRLAGNAVQGDATLFTSRRARPRGHRADRAWSQR